MAGYEKAVFGLSALVNFFLLLGTGRFCRIQTNWGRILTASVLGGVQTVVCLLPNFYFLGNIWWRMVGLAVMTVIAYGISLSAVRVGILFSLLSLAVGGIGQGGLWQGVSIAGLIFLMCYLGFPGGTGSPVYVPVELSYKNKHLQLTALQDTGNTLRDPITGHQVLVVGASVAYELTGLTREQLSKPVESVAAFPGLRLIPYHTIGNSSFLLAMRIPCVKIGSWQGSSLVAFAPEGLGMENRYQALTGGVL